MKILFAYNSWANYATTIHENIAALGRRAGLDITTFILTPNAPHPRYTWHKLDQLWRRRYPPLVKMFNQLRAACEKADVLWVYNGANFHPAWLSKLPQDLLKVYGCFDDPESSPNLSAPVARYFDVCLVGNIASVPQYQGWGCHNVKWVPFILDYMPKELKRESISANERQIDLVFFGTREVYRKKRIDYLVKHFPDAHYYGNGWPKGSITSEKMLEFYNCAKIGINIHFSTGPINKRLFQLPAHGVMQLCDNKSRLGQIFDLNKEVVGFDSIVEAVELIRYYLEHDREREEIAWHGHQRFLKDYTPIKLWEKYGAILEEWHQEKAKGTLSRPKEYKEQIGTVKPVLKKMGRRLLNLELKPAPERPVHKKILALGLKPVVNTIVNTSKKVLSVVAELEKPKTQYPYIQTAIGNTESEPYHENPEFGPSNIVEKQKRQQGGVFFEWPNMVALNWAVASMIGSAKRIIEVGSGTGCFADEASTDPSRTILCLEADEGARLWAQQNRKRPNIVYADINLQDVKEVFDLLVAIDVVEHIADYKYFLSQCCRVAKRAIITTPNRFRFGGEELMPAYKQHVREWSAGEFYWVLKTFWPKVKLYSRPDPYLPLVTPVDINTTMLDLIAVCS